MLRICPLALTVALALMACDSKKTAPSPAASSTAASLAEGSVAPDVSMTLQDGKTVKLADMRGSTVLVYFYPKDGTGG